MNQELHHLLEQYSRLTGRGNMITANETMVTIIQRLADLYQPCQCRCASSAPRRDPDQQPVDIGLAPEGIEDPSLIPDPAEPTKPRRDRPPKLRPV